MEIKELANRPSFLGNIRNYGGILHNELEHSRDFNGLGNFSCHCLGNFQIMYGISRER
jgi:hypothetical protein